LHISAKFEILIFVIDAKKRDEIHTRVLKKEQVYVVVGVLEGMLDLKLLAHIVDVQPLPSLSP